MSVDSLQLFEPGVLELLDEADVPVPRGEPRRLLADFAKALATRAPESDRQLALEEAATALWDETARERVGAALERRGGSAPAADVDAPAHDNPLALALAYRESLPYLARDELVQAPLEELEPAFAELDAEDRARTGAVLAQAAIPALPLDLGVMKDEGYYFVSVFPPEGSEGVDIIGKAAKWLTKRMTMDGDAPRVVMRRFLPVLAEEVEVELPAVAETIDLLLAEPVPPTPVADRLFVALARGLVEEAVSERGFPF